MRSSALSSPTLQKQEISILKDWNEDIIVINSKDKDYGGQNIQGNGL